MLAPPCAGIQQVNMGSLHDPSAEDASADETPHAPSIVLRLMLQRAES